MTMKERVLAVIRGRPHDRVPFIQLSGMAAPNEEIWSVVGRRNMGLLVYLWFYNLVTPNCSFEEQQFERDGNKGVRTILRTPKGDMMQERLIEPALQSPSTVRHFVQSVEDYAKVLAYLRDIRIELHPEWFQKAAAQVGEDGVLSPGVPFQTPYQGLWIRWTGLENLCLHLADYPDVLAEVIAEWDRQMELQFDMFCRAAEEVDFACVLFGDNITAPVIGEPYFRKYALPYYNRLADRLAQTGKDIPVAVHMDGEIKPLWSAISDSKVRLIDSFTPAPDTQTTVKDAISLWPQMRLGLNFPSSVHLRDEAAIYKAAMEILEQGGHTGRLIIQISEDPPKGAWRKSFPQIVEAIRDFGPV